MQRPLRLALGIIGLAATVYGVASLTGGWLGEPPWWRTWRTYGPKEWRIFELEPERREGLESLEFLLPRDGREWISASVAGGGLALLLIVTLLNRDSRGLRFALGIAGTVTALAACSWWAGTWLGPPVWWVREVPDAHGRPIDLEPQPGRDYISLGVMAVSLALVAVAAWPRRAKVSAPRGG